MKEKVCQFSLKAVTLILFFAIYINVSGQTNPNFAKANTWEIGGSISYSHTFAETDYGKDANYIKAAPYAGIFVTEGLEIGFIPAVEYFSYGSSNYTTVQMFLAPSYNFYTNSIAYPYIQAGVGFSGASGSGSSSSSGLVWSLEGGVKLHVFKNALIKIGLDYTKKDKGASNSFYTGPKSLNLVAGFNVLIF